MICATLIAIPGAERCWLRFPVVDDGALNAAGALALAVGGAADECELGLFWVPAAAVGYVLEHLRGAGVEVAVDRKETEENQSQKAE
jgi:hypothetical protein